MRGRVKSFIAQCHSKVPDCSPFHLLPTLRRMAPCSRLKCTYKQGGGEVYWCRCATGLLLLSGPTSQVKTEKMRILRRKKSQSKMKKSVSQLPFLLSMGKAMREVCEEGIAKSSRINRCSAELASAWNCAMCKSMSESSTITYFFSNC